MSKIHLLPGSILKNPDSPELTMKFIGNFFDIVSVKLKYTFIFTKDGKDTEFNLTEEEVTQQVLTEKTVIFGSAGAQLPTLFLYALIEHNGRFLVLYNPDKDTFELPRVIVKSDEYLHPTFSEREVLNRHFFMFLPRPIWEREGPEKTHRIFKGFIKSPEPTLKMFMPFFQTAWLDQRSCQLFFHDTDLADFFNQSAD